MAEFKRKPRFGDRREFGRSERRDGGRSNRRFGDRDRPERTTVTCDLCKKKCEVPFKPTSNKPVYCDDCFKKKAPRKDSRSGGPDLSEINQKLDKILKLLETD